MAAASAAIAVFAVPGIANAAPSAVSVDGTSGTLTFHATSTAAFVQFQVDSETALDPVAVTSGAAQATWDSLGYPNVQHTLSAFDCSDATTCDTTTAATTNFLLSNDVPVITSPSDGATVVGGVDIGATFTSGSLKVLLDGTEIDTATASPFAKTQVDPGTTGLHDIVAVQCSVDLTRCNGPSDLVQFTADGLHPTIGSFSPSRFSPNGDAVKDTSTVTYTLDRDQTVTLTVYDSLNNPVYATTPASQTAGTHTFTWNGKNGSQVKVPDGTYHVRLASTADVNGVTVSGQVGPRYVAVDTVRPAFSSVTGGGVTFYPYKDGYKDTFSPTAVLSEGGTLKLVVTNSNGRVVRTISASKAAGRRSLTWNGRYASGTLVPAGKYHWTFTDTDAAGNHRTTAAYVVYVSAKRLVRKTTAITKSGNAYKSVDHDGCGASASKANSAYSPNGVLLSVSCGGRPGVAVAQYNLQLPSAIRYGRMSFQTYGRSHRGYAFVIPLVYATSSRDYELSRYPFEISSSSTAWRGLGSVPVRGHYTAGHVVHIAVGIGNAPQKPADLDIRYVRVRVTYYVLR